MILYFQQQGSQQFHLPLHENNIGRGFAFSGIFSQGGNHQQFTD
jgi:hypothetical protein